MKIALSRATALATALLAALVWGGGGGCQPAARGPKDGAKSGASSDIAAQSVGPGPLQAVDLNDPVRPVAGGRSY
jgi:hypothetical protein